MERKPAYIISDEPEDQASEFGFDAYATTLTELIAYKKNRTPLVIGIYGPWGSGKTTLLKTVQESLKTLPSDDPFRPCKTVWFQAWKYAEEDALLAALIEEIFKAMRHDGFPERIKGEIEKLCQRLNVTEAVKAALQAFLGDSADLTGTVGRLKHEDKLPFYEAFKSSFERLIWAYVTKTGLMSDEDFKDEHGALVVFIDDLDRCPQPRIVSVLETIKLFLDIKGCVFVIGAEREAIESAIRHRYGQHGKPARFLDKLVQVSVTLPKISEDDIGKFMLQCAPKYDALKEFTPLLAKIMNFNLRQVKRFVNNLSFLQSLFVNRGLTTEADALVQWVVLEYAFPELAKLVKDNAGNISVFQEKIKALEEKGEQTADWNLPEDILKDVQIPDSLLEFVKDAKAVELMRTFPTDTQVIHNLVHFSATASQPEELDPTRSKDVLPGNRIVKVPHGGFLYGNDKQKLAIDHDYSIDIYPVTNEQYARFIEAGGYRTQEYWKEGWEEWKKKEKIVQPRYWDDSDWNQPDHPVVGVSYYEARAYAKWANKRLPTEQEWEKAARGTDGRKYPWGEEFDVERCNSDKSGLKRTTPVKTYANGISPYGCYDMAGNVWEWTASWYEESSKEHQVLRGGSWANEPVFLRSAFRTRYSPDGRDANIGFRCAQDAP